MKKEFNLRQWSKDINFWCWFAATPICTLGLCLCTKSGLGISMIGALPYIIHKYMVQFFPWYSQGTSEYIIQALVIIIAGIAIHQFKKKWVLSFLTAVIVGFCIDGWLLVLGGNGIVDGLVKRIIFFALGMVLTSAGISLYFRTRMPLQAYELAVIEIADKYHWDNNKVKYVNDILYLVLSIILSLLLLHKLVGIGVGTIIITFLNAPLIALFTKLFDKIGIPK